MSFNGNPDLERLTKAYLPMSEASFLLLSTLLEENHGYALMQDVLVKTGGRVNLGAGTVYTILLRMERDGVIRVVSENERRKVYQITGIGKNLLLEESARLCELGKIAQETIRCCSSPVAAERR